MVGLGKMQNSLLGAPLLSLLVSTIVQRWRPDELLTTQLVFLCPQKRMGYSVSEINIEDEQNKEGQW